MTGISLQVVDQDKGIPELALSDGHRLSRSRCESYLHYEFTSLLLRFVDDVEFVFDDEAKTIHFRSASRTGYGDLGVNRARMEQVRALVGEKL